MARGRIVWDWGIAHLLFERGWTLQAIGGFFGVTAQSINHGLRSRGLWQPRYTTSASSGSISTVASPPRSGPLSADERRWLKQEIDRRRRAKMRMKQIVPAAGLEDLEAPEDKLRAAVLSRASVNL